MRAFKPSPAMVVALLALVFAMAGTGLAAKTYIVTSSSQIKDGSVRSTDVKNSSLTGVDIKDRSLTTADFVGSVQGPQGAAGSQGIKGDKGDSGATNVATRRVSADAASGTVKFVQVSCEPGETVTGGGASDDLGSTGVNVIRSAPTPGNQVKSTGWQVIYHNTTGGSHTVWAYVLCARP